MTSSAEPGATVERLRAALVQQLADDGLLSDPRWRRAVEAVPRHQFVPGFYRPSGQASPDGLTQWIPITKATDADAWLVAAYADETLITQFDGDEPDWQHPEVRSGGAPTSSSTLPSLVLRMWQDANLDDDQNVLEIGTGTGYSTALACERVGDHGGVVSIEVDPSCLDQAANALYGCGYDPVLAVADGLYGYRPHAPYDRVVAACSVRGIPPAWLAQTRPGGQILTTLGGWLYGHARVKLTVHADGTADGPLLAGTISFMAARAQDPPPPGNPHHWENLATDTVPTPARHGPERITDASSASFFARFLAQLAAPNAQLITTGEATYVIDAVSGSVAILTGHGNDWQVRQAGPIALWAAIEDTLDAWDAAGRPGPETFHMYIDAHGQHIRHPSVPALSYTLPSA